MLLYLKKLVVLLCYFPIALIFILGIFRFDIPVFIIAALSIVMALTVMRFCKRASNHIAMRMQIILNVITLYFLLVCGYMLAVEPAWDFGRIYHGALDITTNDVLTYTMPYYLESNNNFFITLCLVPWFKLMSVFGVAPLYSGILLNCLCIIMAIEFAVWAANIHISYQHGLFVQISCMLFLPLYSYAPIFYTDTLSMPFVTFGVLIYVLAKDRVLPNKISTALYVFSGIMCFIGFKLKPTVAITYIAIVILSVLNNYKVNMKRLAVSIFTLFVCIGAYRTFLDYTSIIDLTDIDDYRLPVEHYIMMGLKYNGGYNEEDHFFSLSFDNIEDRKEADVEQIKIRLSNYGVKGYLDFLQNKIRYTWLDGTYFAPHKLSIDPIRNTILSDIFVQGKEHNSKYTLYVNGLHLRMILFMILGIDSKSDVSMLCAMSVFAIFIFLLIWETRSRYIVNYIPVFILLASMGVKKVEGIFNGKEI